MFSPIQDIQLINYITRKRSIKNPKKLYKIPVVGNQYFEPLPNKLPKNIDIMIENDFTNKHDKNALLVKYKINNKVIPVGFIPRDKVYDFRKIKNKLHYLGIVTENTNIAIIGELKS